MRVVVVGAGLAGCSVAWHLRSHASVIVVDRADAVGSEASADNAGMVRRMGEDPAERALAIRTVEWLESDERFSGASTVTGAVLALAHDRWHLHDAASHLRARGVRVEPCDRPSELAPALARSPLPFAWWCPDERVADPHALLSVFCAGVERRLGTAVSSLLMRGGRVVGVVTSNGTLEADAVVIAGGAWSAGLAPCPLFPVRRTLVQTKASLSSTPSHPWVWVDDDGIYARPEAGGWLVSGCDELVDPPPDRPGSRGPVDALHQARALDKLGRWMPALQDARPMGGWSGLRTFAPDRRPILGADAARTGLFWAAGLGGFGVTCSVAVGEFVAASVQGQAVTWLDPASVSPGRQFPRRWAIRSDGRVDRATLISGVP